jgi:hypothetical protein
MIAAILNADQVSEELVALVGDRAEGNPFVLEEMLREALDSGETSRPKPAGSAARSTPCGCRRRCATRCSSGWAGWRPSRSRSLGRRLCSVARSSTAFDRGGHCDEAIVLAALESATVHQLLEEAAERATAMRGATP